MYSWILILHSWNRWLVLASGVASIGLALKGARHGTEWTRRERTLNRVFIGALDLQLTFGLLLYFVLSPLVPRSLPELRAAMHVAALRFFAIEHITMMLLGVTAAHVSLVLSRRAPNAGIARRRFAGGMGLALLLILAGIPWPWMSAGRPLARMF